MLIAALPLPPQQLFGLAAISIAVWLIYRWWSTNQAKPLTLIERGTQTIPATPAAPAMPRLEAHRALEVLDAALAAIAVDTDERTMLRSQVSSLIAAADLDTPKA